MIDSSFRREAARMVAGLTRALGPGRLDLAEDAVQEAFMRAMHQWPSRGTPPNPAAWLYRVARNYAIDRLRREGIYASEVGLDVLPAPAVRDEELPDDELRMLLLCVHPALPTESQIALTLRTVCGLGVREIARGLLSTEEAVGQRILRAKNALREADAEFEMPEPVEAASRVETVRRVLYLVFNEGYAVAEGEALTDADLCDEALMLVARLAATPIGDEPATHALVALMLLHSSRLPVRVCARGNLMLLEHQDRSLWDRVRIGAGLTRLSEAARGDTVSRYHVEAAIAACHAVAPSFAATDWGSVLAHYNDLLGLVPSPVVRLNRVVALAMVEGYGVGLAALEELAVEPKLCRYGPYYATRGWLLKEMGRAEESKAAYALARDLATNAAERRFLARSACPDGYTPPSA